jgi:ergothioneine biosynthesis protein EgtB
MPVTPLSQSYRTVRAHSLALAAPLSAEDCCVQSMPDASPIKWHLGHTSWFFETFVLERWEAGFKPFDADFRVLFNSYYNAVGAKHPRPQRGLLTRPSLERVLDYRRRTDQRLLALLAAQPADSELRTLVELGVQHEQQHQELMCTDILHLFSRSPLLPAYTAQAPSPLPVPDPPAQDLRWRDVAGGVVDIGHAGPYFCFDNELPRHQVFLRPYRLASRLVSNSEYAAFIAAGGYADPVYWLAEGWDWRVAQARAHPLYWHLNGAQWQEFTLGGLLPLDAQSPVRHVSYYEAEAYARWAKARLPTEFEWEHAVASASGADAGLLQLFDTAWQWTTSSYAAYPGFRERSGAVGEYNGKFMVNQYVLRGGSVATPPGHSRSSYRNFFPATACWQFTGIRLAQDT